ncbi:unnamed protein product, partial [Rotaria sp. Silwood2]
MTLEQIHRNFGQTWAINPPLSLFYYESGDSATFYWMQNQNFTPSFLSPQPSPTQISQTQTTCGITSNNQSAWTVAQRTCYYDVAVTNDMSFGRTSLTAGDEVLAIAVDSRNPPVFNSGLQLTINAAPSTLVTLDFSAVSAYTLGVLYTLLSGPNNCTFDNQTALFTWQAPSTPDNDTA